MRNAHARVLQDDLFAAPKLVGVVPRSASPKVRQLKTTSLEAGAARKKDPRRATLTQIVLSDICGNWMMGRTRQELADRCGIKLQTVCGIANALLKAGKVWEPTMSYDAKGRPVPWKRDGRAVLVDSLYNTADWDLGSVLKRIA